MSIPLRLEVGPERCYLCGDPFRVQEHMELRVIGKWRLAGHNKYKFEQQARKVSHYKCAVRKLNPL